MKKKKKSSILKYKILKKDKTDRIKGIKLIILQKRFDGWKFIFIPTWEKKQLVVWKPDLKNYPNLIRNNKINNNNWFIMENDFEIYSDKAKIKHICLNKKLLKKLIKFN
jgi:hypothetical protein